MVIDGAPYFNQKVVAFFSDCFIFFVKYHQGHALCDENSRHSRIMFSSSHGIKILADVWTYNNARFQSRCCPPLQRRRHPSCYLFLRWSSWLESISQILLHGCHFLEYTLKEKRRRNYLIYSNLIRGKDSHHIKRKTLFFNDWTLGVASFHKTQRTEKHLSVFLQSKRGI